MGLMKSLATDRIYTPARRHQIDRLAQATEASLRESMKRDAQQILTDREFNDWALSSLKRSWIECGRCELSGCSNKVVWGEGPGDSDIVIVGDAPGASEDEQGIPFVGDSGVLLRKIIAGLKIEPYITNSVLCRTPRDRTPRGVELDTCRPRLQSEIAMIRPQALVLLGRTAAGLCQGDPPRGVVPRDQWPDFEWPDATARLKTVVWTWHPSYILSQKNRGAKRIALNQFLADLKCAIGALDQEI